MKNSILMISVFTVLMLSFNNIKAQTANKPAANSGGAINIKVPDFADPVINKYYHDYAANFIEYVKAIRQNDKVKAKAAMEKDFQFYVHGLDNIDAMKQLQLPQQQLLAEQHKVEYFENQIKPYYEEIKNTEYMKEEMKRISELPDSNN